MGKVTVIYKEKGNRKKGGRESRIMNTQYRLVNRELRVNNGEKKLRHLATLSINNSETHYKYN